MMNEIIQITLKIYKSIGVVGVGIILFIIIIVVFLYKFLKKKLNPYTRAKKFYSKGNLEKAILFLLEELNNNPLNKDAMLLKADIEIKLKLYREAEKDYYYLIYKKKPGDGIVTLEIKKRLLLPLYKQVKLLETFKLSKEILKFERNCGEALYFLAIIYMDQLYYYEAARILERLVLNRPFMHEAQFAYAVTLTQLREYDKSLNYIQKAINIKDNSLYRLIHATILYLKHDYQSSTEILKGMIIDDKVFDTKKEYNFALKLYAFCNYLLGYYEEAVKTFQKINDGMKNKGSKIGFSLYNETGRKDSIVKKDSSKLKSNPVLQEFWKLKELAIEEGKNDFFKSSHLFSSFKLLDIEGLNQTIIPGIDLGFSMIRGGYLKKSIDLFKELKASHPEIIGLNKIIRLIKERINEKKSRNIYEVTERIVSRKNRRYELWEYIEKWEKESIKPYNMILVSGFATKKQLNPLIFFKRDDFLKLDF